MTRPVFPSTDYRRYFVLSFAISWGCWIPAALSGGNAMSFPLNLLLFAGGVGPMVVALALVGQERSREVWRDYFGRAVDIRRISARWHLAIWLLVPVLNLVAIALASLLLDSTPQWDGLLRLAAAPLSFIPFALGVLAFGPIPEELGWRGYALDGLQTRHGALVASLVLGLVWALWHLPMFFMQGTFQSQQIGLGLVGFLAFNASIVASAVLYTWLYNNTGRSTLSAILLHFVVNLSGEVMNLTPEARAMQSVLFVLCAVAIVRLWGEATLADRNKKAAG
jgi:membrane protease YdiL (CAAX protease family)